MDDVIRFILTVGIFGFTCLHIYVTYMYIVVYSTSKIVPSLSAAVKYIEFYKGYNVLQKVL